MSDREAQHPIADETNAAEVELFLAYCELYLTSKAPFDLVRAVVGYLLSRHGTCSSEDNAARARIHWAWDVIRNRHEATK